MNNKKCYRPVLARLRKKVQVEVKPEPKKASGKSNKSKTEE